MKNNEYEHKHLTFIDDRYINRRELSCRYYSLNKESITYDDVRELDDLIHKQINSGMEYGISVTMVDEKPAVLVEWYDVQQINDFSRLAEAFNAFDKYEYDMGIRDLLIDLDPYDAIEFDTTLD